MPEVDYLTKAIENLELAEKTMPVNSQKEVRDVVEELIYLRLRVSQGDAR